MEYLKKQITSLTTTEWDQLYSWISLEELPRRQAAPITAHAVAEEKSRDAVALWQAHPELKPTMPAVQIPDHPTEITVADAAKKHRIKEYRQPQGAHDAYPKTAKFTYEGRIWEVLIDGYVWPPTDPTMDERYRRDITDLFITNATTPTETTSTDTTTVTWRAGLDVVLGQTIGYEGASYTVLQSHKTQVGWEPPNLPALFRKN